MVPVSSIRPALVFVASSMVFAALAGCLGGASNEADAAADVPTQDSLLNPDLKGDDLAEEVAQTLEITAESEVPAPLWTVGEYWTFDTVFSESLGGGSLTSSVVVAFADGDSYTLLSDSRDAAMFEAMFDLPFFGDFDKATLDTTFGGVPFKYYDWPLSEGKSWTAEFDPGFEAPEPYTFHAAFMPEIPTPAGALPGYDIHGIDPDDFVAFQYDYVPALHWFNHVYWFNEEFPNDLSKADVHLMVTDHGFNWRGELITFAQELALEKFWAMDPTMQMQSTPVTTEPPVETFTIAEGATDVGGLWFAGACDGATVLQLESPSGNKLDVRKTVAPNPADGVPPVTCEFEFDFVDTPAEVGQWSARIVGVSPFFAGGFLQVFALTAQTITLGGPAEA